MEIKNFRTFKKIAELGSFTKAAQDLGYAQSTLTFQVQAIERYYQKPLFERVGKNMELTQFGQQLLEHIDILLSNYEKLEQLGLQDINPEGVIRIGTPESLMIYRLYPIIKKYKQLYPKVEIIIIDDQCKFLREQLNSGDLDIAFLVQPEYTYANIKTILLKKETLCLVAPTDLEGEDFLPAPSQMVLFTEKECSYRQIFSAYMQSLNFFPTNILETESVEAIKKYVINGLGISYLPLYAVEEECANGKMRIKPYDSGIQLYTQIAYHKNKWLNPALSALIELSVEYSKGW
ncbi:MAG: LysR family transcriptional regulator [Firmicutes bacterium HGW-Firmicutes-1]|jgi:DNA-binding transcriptional LysR family regulator|nr:MAG: LysR family transcriptional regulator [Firmicutes bacterium HGW-Firmicutes-1]